jgi:hypothetical protein
MACTHTAAMAILGKWDAYSRLQSIALYTRAAAQLLKAYTVQLAALRKLRHGGSQHVRVEHVHINEGGQAVIGNVTPAGK